MVIELPDLESFAREAKKAGVEAVYVGMEVEHRRSNGVPFWRARCAVTAAGLVSCHAGGAEKAPLRYERDFGPVLADLASGNAPEDYRRQAEGFAEEARKRLSEAGFEVRSGIIAAL